MRILYDHQAFSLQSHGGITRVFSEIIRYLNTQPSITTDLMLGFSDTRTDFTSLVSSRGRVIRPGAAIFNQNKLNYASNEIFSALMAPLLGKYDIYHSTYYRFLPLIRSTRKVTTHHDCIQEWFPHLFRNSGEIIRLKKKMFHRADLIICVSAASKADLLHFYDVPAEKALVIHNGVSPMIRNASGKSELRNLLSGDFLLYVGARHSYKNFNGLLQAFAVSSFKDDLTLLAIGGGPPSAEHLAIIQTYGLSGRVCFVPYASSAMLAEAYAEASLLIYPSRYEGFGMPPLEAASVGCVSLVAENPATTEICQNAVFYFDASNQDEFSRMLSVALTDTSGRADRLRRAKKLLETYTWEECARKTLGAYSSLL